MRKTGDWQRFTRMLAAVPKRITDNAERELYGVAEQVRSSMVTGITSKRFDLAPNAESTIKQKGSSTPLVNDGDLVGSIDTHKMDENGYLVGAHKSATDREGNRLANIFAILTYGVDTIARNGQRMQIPPRDAISPALKENEQRFKDAGNRIIQRSF